jgi:hypothetical protein
MRVLGWRLRRAPSLVSLTARVEGAEKGTSLYLDTILVIWIVQGILGVRSGFE